LLKDKINGKEEKQGNKKAGMAKIELRPLDPESASQDHEQSQFRGKTLRETVLIKAINAKGLGRNLRSGRFKGGQTFPGVVNERPEPGLAVFPEADEFIVVLVCFTL
jgi:hypothetical protein